MALRAVKNSNNVIIANGTDFGQGGQDYNGQGVWCNWSFENHPAFTQEILDYLSGLPALGSAVPFCFKENATADGIELRSLVDIQNDPYGSGE